MNNQFVPYQALHLDALERFGEKMVGGAGEKHRKNARKGIKTAMKALMKLNKEYEKNPGLREKHVHQDEHQHPVHTLQSILSPDEYERLNDTFNTYYRLKMGYDKIAAQRKVAMMNDPAVGWKDLSVQQKMRRLQGIKKQCCICKQDGGTIFTNENGVLKALCGNISQPCSLHLEINRGKFVSLEELMSEALEDVHETKEKIIRMKLDLLFNFLSVDEVMQTFDTVSAELSEQYEIYGEFRTYYLNIIANVDVRNAVDEFMRMFHVAVKKIKDTMAKFKEGGFTDTALIEHALYIYQSEIEEGVFKNYNSKKYVYREVEEDKDGKLRLVQKEFSYKELYMPIVVPSVIANSTAIVKIKKKGADTTTAPATTTSTATKS